MEEIIESYKGKGKGSHPNSLAVLKQHHVKKHHAPLPGCGRPKGSISLKERMKRILLTPRDGVIKIPDGKFESAEQADIICIKLLQLAQAGNMKAIQTVLNYFPDKQDCTLVERYDINLVDSVKKIINLAIDGEVSIRDAIGVGKLLEIQAKMIELEQMKQEIVEIKEELQISQAV